jgi:uncharacterized protein YecE (DUF72 family)
VPKRIIRVGPAGWSYKDWEGTVYPQKPGKSFDPLEYIARFFNTVEINSSFYRPPTPSTTKSWANRVAANKEFAFTAKLHRLFTHERGKATMKDEKEYREGMDVLAKTGKLGSVLLQFPWSFKNTDEDRGIDALFRKTRDRHRRDRRSGHRPDVVDRIERRDAAVVVRVVDDWSEEVERLHEREVVAKTVYSRVVGCIEADNQIRIGRLFG